ncbi:hypothetical protein GYRE_01252 [Yokenella regensburgei ATCC 49455]|jgi:hypothetical protein|nr:hypothetical protein HMPREF0880_01087 [Yokenella regensburgei ATCC 43003]KFD24299.1 hypothetical protein GYRE_01252 [Yokenella regensburgei ATCC 49455]
MIVLSSEKALIQRDYRGKKVTEGTFSAAALLIEIMDFILG